MLTGYSSNDYAFRSAAAARQAAYAREMQRRMAQAVRRAQSDAARLAVAEEALQSNDIESATTLYLRVAHSRVPSAYRNAARQRLAELTRQGTARFEEMERELEQLAQQSASEQDTSPVELISEWFAEAERFADDYERVPRVGRAVRSRLAQLRRQPQYASRLHEPEAAHLLQIARQQERDGSPCCAFQVLEEAARLVPAPSAVLAEQRLLEMQEDAELVASAETCRDLQWCHRTFATAERIVDLRPERARDLFLEIVDRAPRESRVHREATLQLARLD